MVEPDGGRARCDRQTRRSSACARSSPTAAPRSGIAPVSDDDAFATARELARREGLFAGQTSGANLFVARRLAAELGPGRRVVTILIDSGLKYLAGDLFAA